MAAVLVASCRPYKATYMNVLDTIVLVHLGLSGHLISSYNGFENESNFLIATEVMFALPFVGSVLYVLVQIVLKSGIVGMLLQMCKKALRFRNSRSVYMPCSSV